MKSTHKKASISVIMPCYNDTSHINDIVSELKRSRYIKEIIIVDDGSNKRTKNILKKIHDIKLITHDTNKGKSLALKTGILNSTADTILFLDSDLINIKASHIDMLTSPVINREYSLNIGDFIDKYNILFNKFGQTFIFSGIRCIDKKLLIDNIDIFDNDGYIKGYLVETKMNQKFFGKIRIKKTHLPNITQDYKYQKIGIIKGIFKDIVILSRLYSYMGIKQTLDHLRFARSLN